ncbi:MAG: AAA family ATPase [Candidatus Altiarchaeota archaeon]|nr:AAA family ATPase [Candidatus Altiarchaeota archaeon]
MELRFVDRKTELWQLGQLINTPPNFVQFVYGPKSSGKSTLMMRLVRAFGRRRDFIFYDFRARSPKGISDVLALPQDNIFVRFRTYLKGKLRHDPGSPGIKVPKKLYEKIRTGKIDPFLPLIPYLRKMHKPVIILDEVQALRFSGMSDDEIARLMNFLVTLTKRMHLAHVIVVTSDCLFIDDAIKLAALEEASEFNYLGDLGEDAVREWLQDEGLTEEQVMKVYQYFGGRPYDLWVTLQNFAATGNLNHLEKTVMRKLSRVRMLASHHGQKTIPVLKRLASGNLTADKVSKEMLKWLIDNEIAFFDPLDGTVYPISNAMSTALKRL